MLRCYSIRPVCTSGIDLHCVIEVFCIATIARELLLALPTGTACSLTLQAQRLCMLHYALIVMSCRLDYSFDKTIVVG